MTQAIDDHQAPPRKRGRPSRKATEAIDRRVLDVAWTCFAENGLEAVTMEDIAERAGVAKATLYARHPSRSVLLEAVITDRVERWSAEASGNDWTMGESLVERLAHYGRSMLRWSGREEIAAARLMIRSVPEGGGLETRMNQLLRAPMIELLVPALRQHMATCGCEDQDPHVAAAMFLGLLMGYPIAQSFCAGGSLDQDHFVDLVVRLFVHGLGSWKSGDGAGVSGPAG